MNSETKHFIDEQLSYAAHDFIRDAGLHNLPGYDWDSLTEELKNFLFAKAEVWLCDKATEIEAAKIAEFDRCMDATAHLDDPRLVGVGQ